MLKFFTARDDENESLLGAITEDEVDAPSLMDSKHHWLSRPCLLVLKDGDIAKPALSCEQIRTQSPSRPAAPNGGGGGGGGGPMVRCLELPADYRKPEPQEPESRLQADQHHHHHHHHQKSLTPHLESQSQRLLQQLEEGTCTVTTISAWGERCLRPGSPLALSPAETTWPEVAGDPEEEKKEEEEQGEKEQVEGDADREVEEQEDRGLQCPPSKEDSVVEEKEREESGLEHYQQQQQQQQQQESCGVETHSSSASSSSSSSSSSAHGHHSHDAEREPQDTGCYDHHHHHHHHHHHQGEADVDAAGAVEARNEVEDAKVEEVEAEEEDEEYEEEMEGAVGDGASASSLDPDNERQLVGGRGGILSRERGAVLGEVAPVWVPDAQALVCMKCQVKFTFTKRRHHCRACGKVFCAVCSNLKFRLTHLDGKEGRVCISCHSTLMKRSPPRGRRRVWFADEILSRRRSESAPTTPVREPAFSPLTRRALGGPTGGSPVGSPQTRRSQRPQETAINEACGPYGWSAAALVSSHISSSSDLIPLDGLPPILTSTGVKGDYTVEERPCETLLIQELENGRPKPLVFVLNANLLAMVKMVNYVNRKCWCVTSKGMHALGQVELVVLLQCLPEEKSFPKDIFRHFIQLYRDALTGKVVKHLSLSLLLRGFLGSEEHAGFLYVGATLQSLQGLPLPNQPYLFALLVHRAELAWAKAFPLRLMLRLGAEYRFYPCPLYNVRFRKPLFGETGHTIMRLLVDFRNYRYSLPVVPGLTVDLEAQKTCIKIPKDSHNELMKVLNKSNDHVLAMGACFNEAADSHLICVQAEDGQYQTQAISIHNQPRKVTGSCFFVFSSALKASAGYMAKSSIVEDGLMVQITVETMAELRRSLREMKDYTVTCGRLDQSDSQEHVRVDWLDEKCVVNKGIISPIDGKSMESIKSTKMFQKSEYKENGKIIRWTEVFFLQRDDDLKGGLSDCAEHHRLTERIARAFCLALCPHLKLLKEDGMAKLGLRVSFDSQEVGFVAGSNGQPLPAPYLNALDAVLIPVVHSRRQRRGDHPVVMEFIFYILENIT